jgi:hypothetical protein
MNTLFEALHDDADTIFVHTDLAGVRRDLGIPH